MTGLRKQTIISVIWNGIQRFSNQGLQFVVSIILARLLAPTQFGLIAMVNVFTGISYTLIDGGFSTYLIQKKNATSKDFSTSFYLNIGIAIIIYIILFFTAPYFAAFYNEPRVTLIMRVFLLIMVFQSAQIAHYAYLKKNMNFRFISIVNVIAVIISSILGISMAYSGYGIWSLVIPGIISTCMSTIIFWVKSDWKIVKPDNLKTLLGLLKFGSKFTLANLLSRLTLSLYTVAIGRLFSSEILGYYNQANKLQALPVKNMSIVLRTVSFPVFSKLKNDLQALQRAFRKFIVVSSAVLFPILVGLFVTAEAFVEVILTEKWLPMVPYLKILCIAGIFNPLSSYNLNLIVSDGKSGLYLVLEVIRAVLVVAAILLTFQLDIFYLLWGQVVAYSIFYSIVSEVGGKNINYGFIKQVRDLAPYFISSIVMGFVVYAASSIGVNLVLELIVSIIFGVITYFLILYIFKLEAINEFLALLKIRKNG